MQTEHIFSRKVWVKKGGNSEESKMKFTARGMNECLSSHLFLFSKLSDTSFSIQHFPIFSSGYFLVFKSNWNESDETAKKGGFNRWTIHIFSNNNPMEWRILTKNDEIDTNFNGSKSIDSFAQIKSSIFR